MEQLAVNELYAAVLRPTLSSKRDEAFFYGINTDIFLDDEFKGAGLILDQ